MTDTRIMLASLDAEDAGQDLRDAGGPTDPGVANYPHDGFWA